MSKKSFRRALLIVVGTFMLLGLLGGYLVCQVVNYPTETKVGVGNRIEVAIDRGMSFPKIAARLAEKGAIDNARWFRLYAMQRGATQKVRPGVFELADNMTPQAVLDQLIAGVPERQVTVTVPEGRHMLEVFELIAQAGVAKAEALQALAYSREFLDARGITAATVEGYLFPETYRFVVPSAPNVVLDTLLEQHRKVWNQVLRENADSIERLRADLGWSDHDFVVMASIVEKEAVVDRERKRIAQVFINRLLNPEFVPHRLDTDPTIRYGCMVPATLGGQVSAACQQWDQTDRLRRAQLDDTANPYNTYQHDGLPPGPICNPGAKSLEAVADPDGSGYLYFVARAENDGTHIFSKTRADHDKAVRDYVRGPAGD